MSTQTTKRFEQFLKISNKFKILGSIVIIIILVAMFFTVDNFVTPPSDGSSAPTRNLLLSVISGIIPVFLLFVLAYFALNEINNIKEGHKEDILSQKISNNIISSMNWSQADKFFSNRTDESLFIKEAENKLYLLQETGSLVAEKYRSEIVSFLNRGGNIVLLLTMPVSPIANLMSFRNASLNTADDLKRRAKQFESQIKDIIARTNRIEAASLEVRYIPYPIDFTMIMADPYSNNSENKKALIRLAGFKVPFEEKLDFKVLYISSPIVFMNYKKQFLNLYYASSKIILLSGKSKIGKTTLLNNILENYDYDYIEYILSNQILDTTTKKRLGFEVRTSFYTKTKQFATKKENGEYDVNQNIWDDVAVSLSKVDTKNKIIILDEIGLMQIKSVKFKKEITKLFLEEEITFIATISDDNETFFNYLKKHHRTKILTLNSDNYERIEKELKNEIDGSLNYLTAK